MQKTFVIKFGLENFTQFELLFMTLYLEILNISMLEVGFRIDLIWGIMSGKWHKFKLRHVYCI